MHEVEPISHNEVKAAAAFSKQAPLFDSIYGMDGMISYKRNRVREHVLRYLPASGKILELNCGTGEDAVFFARKGYHVHATDLSEGMLLSLVKKIEANKLTDFVTHERCSFTQLDNLKGRGPYDLIFSNFGGLNCTNELQKVLQSLDSLLLPGGVVTLVIINDFSLWETMLLVRGKWKTALRRWFKKAGTNAKVEGNPFSCWYYSPSFVRKGLPSYKLVGLEGLCTLVPPSYIEKFDLNYPRLYQWLTLKEKKWCTAFPWRRIGDYFIISLQKPYP